MSNIIKKLFGALVEKPWDENQVNMTISMLAAHLKVNRLMCQL